MSIFNPQTLQGVPVTISEPVNCTELIKRTWKERLFTLPFTPLTKDKEVKTLVDTLEDGQIIKMDTGLYMNAKTFIDCKDAIRNKDMNKTFSTTRR